MGIVECLLTECHCDPNCISSKFGVTPLAVAQKTDIIRLLLQHGAVASDLYKCRKVLPEGSHRKPSQSTVAVFIIGDRGAGKSTLTKALMTEKKGITGLAAKRFKLGGVKEKTAGIECHTIHSSRIGSFTIYDLAGHREFHNSHDTVIRNSISGPSSGMFLFVIDLRASLEDLKQTLSYWLSFVQSQVQDKESVQHSKPYLLAVGSHADSVAAKGDLEVKEILVRNSFQAAGIIHFVGFVAIDCRYSESKELTKVRSHMRNTHDKLQRAIPEMTFNAHCFHVYLVCKCGSKPGMRLGDLMKTIKSDPSSEEWFLPESIVDLREACSGLSKMGIMLFIQTMSTECSWIIVDKDLLLHKVNGSVFAPEDFSERKELTRTGVVPFSKICSEFDKLIKTKEIDPQLIVDFLIHMEFCREMTEDDGLRLVTETHSKYKEERHFLFPALTPATPPPDIWQPNPLISYSEYSSCWLLQCREHHHYLTSRFRDTLLLRLAFTHAFPVKSNQASPALHQKCTMWKNGIKWTTTSSVDVLVEVNDTRVVLLLRCTEGEELTLVHVRSRVINEVLSVKAEFCRNVETFEKVFLNPTYPKLDTEYSVLITDIAHSICTDKNFVLVATHTPFKIERLLFFEPYKFCNHQCLVDILCSHESCKVTQQFIDHVSDNISCVDDFCKKVLNVPLHKIASCSSDCEKAVRMFREWQSQSEGTYHCLRQHMDQYSIFSGKDILVC